MIKNCSHKIFTKNINELMPKMLDKEMWQDGHKVKRKKTFTQSFQQFLPLRYLVDVG